VKKDSAKNHRGGNKQEKLRHDKAWEALLFAGKPNCNKAYDRRDRKGTMNIYKPGETTPKEEEKKEGGRKAGGIEGRIEVVCSQIVGT